MSYFIFLNFFLKFVDNISEEWHNVLGTVPQNITDQWLESLKKWHEDSPDLEGLVKTSSNGYKQYLKSRPGASNESVKRAKTIQKSQNIATHVLLSKYLLQNEHQISIIEQMKNFRPSATIFEIGNTTKNDKIRSVMTDKRQMHNSVIERNKQKKLVQDDPSGNFSLYFSNTYYCRSSEINLTLHSLNF